MLKKWSTKKKIFAIFSIVLVLSVIAGILYYIFKPEPGDSVILTKVYTGDVTQTLDATATVESANQGVFGIIDGTKVVKVNVRVGDKIKKGEVLATFDTDSLQTMVSDKQKAYNSAYEAYTNFKAKAKTSAEDIVQIDKDISSLELEISKLEKKIAAEATTPAAEVPVQDTTTFNTLADKLSSLFGGSSSTDQISAFIKRLMGSGNSLTQVNSFITGLLNGGTSGFDLSSLTGMTADESALTTSQLELLQLKAKQTLLKTQTNNTIESTYKSFYKSAEEALAST